MSDAALYAHSRNSVGVRHGLAEHLRGSAALAGRFGDVAGVGELAAYLALIHDVGKGSCAWQDGLLRAEKTKDRVGVPHKEAGAGLAAEHVAVPFAALVQGHHGGLPDRGRVMEVLRSLAGDGQEADAAREAVKAVRAILPEIVPSARLELPHWLAEMRESRRVPLELDMLSRMLFSMLVDADFLDTSAHFEGLPPRVGKPADMELLAHRFEQRRAVHLANRPPSAVDQVRADIYRRVLAAAGRKPAMYVMHVPTGGGKTLASAGFSLRHAAEHDLQRVVFAVPFISITEQNAQVYRDMLEPEEADTGGPVILEHHSSADLHSAKPAAVWARLAAENWDAPVVVTTTVQLFQSLFANRPSAMRKLHRLAGAVIVLDEVQALPDRLLAPILSVLRSLVDHFGASVVLASATQPEYWTLPQLRGAARLDVVDDVERLFDQLRRVEYVWRVDEATTWESLAEAVMSEPDSQVLIVVNTTNDAACLHRALQHVVDDGAAVDAEGADGPDMRILHLSTRMTAEHRREVISHVRKRLRLRQPMLLVSTSLIEAGVDIDFPCVYRALAPAESLQQAAGRCNRNGNRSTGKVVIFQPSEGGNPSDKAYDTALKATTRYFGPDRANPDDLEALRHYYTERYAAQGTDGRALGEPIQEARRDLDFPKVAQDFQMIENDHTLPVVVTRTTKTELEQEAIAADIASLQSPYPTGPDVLRRLQPHIAALPRPEAQKAVQSRLATPITGDLLQWHGHYHEDRGLDREEPEDRSQFFL